MPKSQIIAVGNMWISITIGMIWFYRARRQPCRPWKWGLWVCAIERSPRQGDVELADIGREHSKNTSYRYLFRVMYSVSRQLGEKKHLCWRVCKTNDWASLILTFIFHWLYYICQLSALRCFIIIMKRFVRESRSNNNETVPNGYIENQ